VQAICLIERLTTCFACLVLGYRRHGGYEGDVDVEVYYDYDDYDGYGYYDDGYGYYDPYAYDDDYGYGYYDPYAYGIDDGYGYYDPYAYDDDYGDGGSGDGNGNGDGSYDYHPLAYADDGVRLHSRGEHDRREGTHGRRLLGHQNIGAPAHGFNEECLNCPAGGNCMAGGDAIKLQLGNWVVRDGLFVLTSCPLGHQLINTVDAMRAVSTNDTSFAHDSQRCKPCEPSTYIIDPVMPCQPCPQGASCPGLIK